jgi:energy-coupling factor transporter ATP-binding protein EcfA2
MGEVAADDGRVEWGYETYPGYVAQDQNAQLGTQRHTVESWLRECCPAETIGFVKGNLAAVLFSGDDAEKRLEALSGGEAARLIFARLVVEKPNVLILDEPTNHLDLEAIEALVEALRSYDGTLILVSHDRWFVGELATRVIEITPDAINDFPGSYDEYIERCGDDHLDARAVLRKVRAEKRGAKASKEKERPARTGASPERQRRKVQQTLDALTEELTAAEARVEELNELFCASDFFMKTPTAERNALEAEHRGLSEKVSKLMEDWEGLEAELAGIPAE